MQYRVEASGRILLETPTSLVSIPHQFALFKTIRGNYSPLGRCYLLSSSLDREQTGRAKRSGIARRRFRELDFYLKEKEKEVEEERRGCQYHPLLS